MNNTNDAHKSLEETRVAETTNSALYEKSQSLVDIANNTFKELCYTLECEQTKLIELEDRRKKLQEEMQRLKMEIEEEKKLYHLNMAECGVDSAGAMSDGSSTSLDKMKTNAEDAAAQQADDIETQVLDTCFEDDNEEDAAGVAPKNVNLVAEDIGKKLQTVVAECIIEQCKLAADAVVN